MIIDLAWTIASLLGAVMAFWDSRYLATFVWLGFGIYAFSNYLEHRLKGTKYDY